MGLFSSSSTSAPTTTTPPSRTPDGAFEAPNRSTRAQCYTARDQFFACLDRNGIVDGIKEKERADAVCGGENQKLEKECAGSWVSSFFWHQIDSEGGTVWLMSFLVYKQVTYFKQRRVMEHKKKQTFDQLAQEGASPMPESMAPPGVKGGGS